jgi:hypothetical protein
MPGPATFNTPLRIITFALRNAGKLDQASEPTSDQYADALPRLNDLINYEQTQGLKLWLDLDISIAAPILTAGTALYTLGPTGTVVLAGKPTRVLQGYYVDSSNNRRPIDPPMAREEYYRLSNVTIQGAITSYYVDKQQNTLNVYLWNTPDAEAASGTVHLITQTQITQMISLTDAMSFPQEWFIYLHWALGEELATGQPQSIINRCSQMAARYRTGLEGWDVEDAATRFVPDSRSMQDRGRFR